MPNRKSILGAAAVTALAAGMLVSPAWAWKHHGHHHQGSYSSAAERQETAQLNTAQMTNPGLQGVAAAGQPTQVTSGNGYGTTGYTPNQPANNAIPGTETGSPAATPQNNLQTQPTTYQKSAAPMNSNENAMPQNSAPPPAAPESAPPPATQEGAPPASTQEGPPPGNPQ